MSDIGDFDFGLGGLAAFAGKVVDAGMSGRAGLLALREAGGRVRDRVWFQVVGEVRAAYADRAGALAARNDILPRDDQITQWSAGRQGVFNFAMDVMMRDRATGEMFPMATSVISDSLMTWDDAFQLKADDFAEAEAEGTGTMDGLAVVTYIKRGLYGMTGPP